MSLFALLPAVRDQLRKQLSLERGECRVMKGPKPPASAGERFFSVFGLFWSPGDPDLNRGIDEYYGVGVCLSVKANHIPDDDQAEESYIKEGGSLENLIRRVIFAIHQSYTVMESANALIPDTTDAITGDPIIIDKFIEPLRWQSSDATPIEVTADWFSGSYLTTIQSGGEDVAGLTMTANFERARRTQTYALMR